MASRIGLRIVRVWSNGTGENTPNRVGFRLLRRARPQTDPIGTKEGSQ